MKVLVGMRSADSSIRFTAVQSLSTPSPEITPHDVLRRWSESEAQLSWLCASGHLSQLGLDEMRQEAAPQCGPVGAAQTAPDVADYIARAMTAGAAMAGLHEAGAWRCWRPMSADDIAAVEQVWDAAHATSVEALSAFDMSFRTTTAKGSRLRRESHALASRALWMVWSPSVVEATIRLAILLAESAPQPGRTTKWVAKHYEWDTDDLLRGAAAQRSHVARRASLEASIEATRKQAKAARELLVSAQNALCDAPAGSLLVARKQVREKPNAGRRQLRAVDRHAKRSASRGAPSPPALAGEEQSSAGVVLTARCPQ